MKATREPRRAVLVGGAGLIGSHVADLLVAGAVPGLEQVVVFDDLSRGRPENLASAMDSGRVRLVEGDVRDRSAVGAVLAGADLVFHLAAIRIVRCASEPRVAQEVLADGTYNVVEACARGGVGKVVFSSSASVYGLATQFPTSEDQHPYGNRTIYGAAKAYGEALLRSFNEMEGLDYVALRYFNVYGERMDTHGAYTEVLVRWMEAIERGEAPLIHGDGSATMDFVHVSDVARANVAAAVSDVTDVVCNVGTGRETSLRQLADALLMVMGSDLSPVHGPERAATNVSRRLADTSRAAELVGFRTSVSLEEGLARLVQWWRAEGEGTGDSDDKHVLSHSPDAHTSAVTP